MPDPADPQSLNRYSYVGNRPTVLVDPSGHSACALPHPGLAAGCWVIEKIALYGSQIINLIQQLTIAAPQAPAMVDMATQAGQASPPASSNAGNTADPGGLDPNDPLFRRLIEQSGETDPIKAIAKSSIEGPAREGATNGVTVLGRYPAYVSTAKDLRANFLNFAEGTWDKLTDAQRWAVNKQFLDDAIARGDTFRLASQLKQAEPGTYFRRELDYLFSLGYQLVDDVLIKVK